MADTPSLTAVPDALYRLATQDTLLLAIFGFLALPSAVGGLVAVSDDGDVWVTVILSGFVAGVIAALLQQVWSRPWIIAVSAEELRFVARRRTTAVPWASLRSVGRPWWDVSRSELVWTWTDGHLRTSSHFENLHRLLATVEQRAPQAKLAT